MPLHPLWRPFVPDANAARQSERLAFRQTDPGNLQPHRESWARDFELIEQVIRSAIPDQVLTVKHVGSTAVAGLIAKPVIDVDVTVRDVTQETSYVPPLQRSGFRLIFRDRIAGDEHRHLTFAQPNTNLHIWNSGAVEPKRHELFVAWLRSSSLDQQLYNDAKILAARGSGSARYNDLKAAVVYDIYEHAFLADPVHTHDQQARQ